MRLVLAFVCVLACSKPEPAPSAPPAGSASPPVDAVSARVVELDASAAVAGPPAPPVDAAVKSARVAPDPDRLRMEAEAARLADLLTSDDTPSGSLRDMSRRSPGADLGASIDKARTGGVGVVGGGGGRGPHGGSARVGSAGPSGSAAPIGRISIASKRAFDDTSLTADAVVAKIQMAYMAGLERCQKSLLAVSPQARGKLDLELAVNERGRATSIKVQSFDVTLDSCVKSLASNWIFPIPKDADGEATDALFAITFQLIPD